MTPQQRLDQFIQDVYLTRYNRRLESLTDTDGLEEVVKTIRWTNTFLQEFEKEADWQFVRDDDKEIATIASAIQVISRPSDVRKLVVDEDRPVIITSADGTIISRFEVVEPNQITRRANWPTPERVTVVGNKIVFSRSFTTNEIGAKIYADTISRIPPLVQTPVDVAPLDTMTDHYQLLVLGVAKNATLPDIVQGGLSPSFVQKYGDELLKAIAENNVSAVGDEVVTEDLSSIGGIY